MKRTGGAGKHAARTLTCASARRANISALLGLSLRTDLVWFVFLIFRRVKRWTVGMDSSEVVVAVGSFIIHQCVFRALEHTTKVRVLYRALQAQKAAKSGKKAGDVAPAEAAKKSSEDEKKARDDCKRLWSCYLSHVHCVVTLGSCLWFWATRPVDVYSPSYMVEVRAPVLSHVPQRCEVAAAVTATASHCVRTRTRTCMHACVWQRTSPNDHQPGAADCSLGAGRLFGSPIAWGTTGRRDFAVGADCTPTALLAKRQARRVTRA